jgi:hypothetical protein
MCAAELRARADEMKEARPKAIMLRIAADYEELEQWAEKNLNVSLLGCSSAAAALSIAISTTRCAWHCGGWSTSRRPDGVSQLPAAVVCCLNSPIVRAIHLMN